MILKVAKAVKARTIGPRLTRPRRYIRGRKTAETFLLELRRLNINYVVQRWFDLLPHVGEGEDVDILVADEDLPKIEHLLSSRIPIFGGQKVDIYSASGLPGTDYRQVACFPEPIARGILERAVWLKDRWRVPCPIDHFRSLAYHAVYHKGYTAGLSTSTYPERVTQNAEHNYAEVLTSLAPFGSYTGPITLDALADHLTEIGWAPSEDMLERLARGNDWIEHHILKNRTLAEPHWRGFTMFIIRAKAEAEAACDLIIEQLKADGFHILSVNRLNPSAQENARHIVRGGNWNKGPWPVNGGLPAIAIAALDPSPIAPNEASKARAPSLDNARIVRAKENARKEFLTTLAEDAYCNPLHSSDNATQAVSYLEIIMPELRADIEQQIMQFETIALPPFPILQDLSKHKRRAAVYVVAHPSGIPAVCKIFHSNAKRFFERELFALQTLRRERPEFPELIEHGDNWLVMRRYKDRLHDGWIDWLGTRFWLLPLRLARPLMNLAHYLHERDLYLLDFGAHNVLDDPDHGIKVIDLEFLQSYNQTRPSFASSYCFAGLPESETADAPVGGDLLLGRSGLTRRLLNACSRVMLHSLIYDPAWLQLIKRCFIGPAIRAFLIVKSIQRRSKK